MSAVLVAAGLDATLGEPPAAVHPVVWMGRLLDQAGRRVPATPPARARVLGGLAWTAGAAATVAAGVLVERLAARLPRPVATVTRGAVLATLCSGRLLLTEVAAVEAGLVADLTTGRRRLARIVSRDPSTLDEAEVRAAALESLAENLADGYVATLLWYAAGGVPAAALHRWANTADAMWGYRTDRWRDAGLVAARADDLLNLAAARVTAALILAAAGAPRPAWRALAAEALRTPSPNGGWPMGALALALDLRLPKPGHYVLNPAGRLPEPADTRAALRLTTRAAAAAVVLAAAAEHLVRRRTHRRRTR